MDATGPLVAVVHADRHAQQVDATPTVTAVTVAARSTRGQNSHCVHEDPGGLQGPAGLILYPWGVSRSLPNPA